MNSTTASIPSRTLERSGLPASRESSRTTDNHVRPLRVGSVGTFLAAAIVVSIPFPPIVEIAFSAGRLPITWLMVTTVLALLNTAVSTIMSPRANGGGNFAPWMAFAAIALMTPPAIFTAEGAAGYLAYLNFAVGVIAGFHVGRAWSQLSLHKLNVLDASIMFFVGATVYQLYSNFSAVEAVSDFHQNSVIPWGNSNYVAGVLVVTGFLLIGRARQISRHRWLPYIFALGAFLAALSTLSRGGAIALASGAAAALWLLPLGRQARVFTRLLALMLPVAAWITLDFIQNQRAQVNTRVYENVDTRFGLWQIAWHSFSEYPFFGSGWAYFRTLSSNFETQTFAHNLALSYIQIGGLFLGVPLLIIIIIATWKSISRYRPFAPALIAILAIAQTDPFTEGSVGGMLLWTIFAFCSLVVKKSAPPNRVAYRSPLSK